MPDTLNNPFIENNSSAPLQRSFIIIDDFLPAPVAAAMRHDIEKHFGDTNQHKAQTHQIWNYWFVPELYTYFRTQPEKIIQNKSVHFFMEALKNWSGKNLGMERISWPYLSLYVNGCQQGLHNDSVNGRFGFVFSLTKNVRKTTGGRTLIMHEGDPFRSKLTRSSAGPGFYEMIEPKFNRLIVFDDRIPHAVDRIEGSMNPVEGRFVMHGHIYDNGIMVTGPLPPSVIETVVKEPLEEFLNRNSMASGLHGPFVIRFKIEASGIVTGYKVLVDRVTSPHENRPQWNSLVTKFLTSIHSLHFPASHTASEVTLPVMFGGSLS